MNKTKRKITIFALSIGVSLTAFFGATLMENTQAVSAETVTTPILWSVSDAVKPGETVSVTGYGLLGDLRVAYAPNCGIEPAAFNENTPPQNCQYIEKIDLLTVDEKGGSGLGFILPSNLQAGAYDIWVKTAGGWSNGITLNAARPLYINQEASYAGLPIEIVGRNFFQSEYGVGTEETSLENVKIKLVRVANVNGEADGREEEKVVGVKTGVRYTAQESVTGEVIAESNPYKITFETPLVENYGTYELFVAADGKDFRALAEPQDLIIYERKAQTWDENVFGTDYSNHIGNDPLDLYAYWAQDLNYTNVEIVSENTSDCVSDITKKVQSLSEKGGGVLYFPEGEYYLSGFQGIASNVIWVGAGADKTIIRYAGGGSGSWLKSVGKDNIGFARMKFTYSTNLYPDMIFNFVGTSVEMSGADVADLTTKNAFVSDVVIDFPFDAISDQRRTCAFSGAKNFIYQNVVQRGGAYPLNCGVREYVNMRNAQFSANNENYSMTISANYTFLENVSYEKNYHGHGISLRNNASVSSCYVARVGNPNENLTIGEALVFEPTNGYFSAGTLSAATARTFTTSNLGGTSVSSATKLSYGNFAIQIIGGTGAGQIRYFKNTPINKTENCYEFLDGEKDWDVVPDSTSRYTIICPMKNATVYRFHAEDCVKGIYLYSQMQDAVVAECKLKNTAGIFVQSVINPSTGRINTNANIRIVNNEITGFSPGTGFGGINVRLQNADSTRADGAYIAKEFGTVNQGIVIRGNTLRDTTGSELVVTTEQTKKSGIVVDSYGQTGAMSASDMKFVTIENNTVQNTQYGIFYDAYTTGLVIRNNEISQAEADTFRVSENKTENSYILDGSDAVRFESVSLSLDGKIGLNIYAEAVDGKANVNDVRLEFKIPGGKTQSYKLTEGELGTDGCYKFTVWLNAEDINTQVQSAIYVAGAQVTAKAFCVADYIESAKFAYSNNTELVALMDALEVYMSAAESYFAGWTVDAVDADIADELANYAYEKTGDLPDDVSGLRMSLTLEESTNLRIYFETKSLDAFDCLVNGVKATVHSASANCYYVEISDIQAKDLATVYDVQLGDCSFKVSALSYANLIVQSGVDNNLVNLMKNVYLYYKAAAAYFA